jgi:hypothetical protein
LINKLLFRAENCDTGHSGSAKSYGETSSEFHVERFNLIKLNEVEGKEHYRAEI